MVRFFCLILIAAAMIAAVGYTKRPVVFINGRILTMDPNNTVVTALGIQFDRIRAAGDHDDVVESMTRLSSESPWHIRAFGLRSVDLKGQNVIPGFVDAHSHFPASGLPGVGLDLSSPPFGVTHDIPVLLRAITAQSQQQSENRWIIGFDYDDSGLLEQRHPTRAELDKAAPDHAVYLRHRSGHMGVANSRALGELGHKDASEVNKPQRRNGLLQEKAAPSTSRLLREISWWRLPGVLFRARDEYLRAGITTVQNGLADKPTFTLLRYAAKFGLVPQRILVWPAHNKLRSAPTIDWPLDDRKQVAIGAVKLIADGSPQGRTAWLSEPYLPDDMLAEGYRGTANLHVDTLHELIVSYHKAGFQLALHGNGDAAIQSIIDGLRAAQDQYPREDARHFIVHAQTIRRAQLHELSTLDVSVTFFPSHTFYWGDWYRQRVLGESRAAMISPLASADAENVRYTLHADSPVTPINPMQILWSASQRLTSSGHLLGAEERVSRLRALRAMTIDAAWQNHLDDDRGSIEVGKLADFIVMSDDPLTSADVRDIAVRQVWIGGRQRL